MVQLLEEDVKNKEVLAWQGVHLLHFAGSSCSQKVRIFLNLKGIDWVSHPVNLAAQENYKPWFLGINPRGVVPVLVHDGKVHIESNDILDYLDSNFAGAKLIPDNLREDILRGLLEEDNLHMDIRALTMRFVVPGFLAAKRPAALQTYADDAGTVAGERDASKDMELQFWRDFARDGITDGQARRAAQNFHQVYSRLDQQLQQSEYLCGQHLTLLDIAWFIYAHRLRAAGYPLSRLHPQVQHWYTRLLARPEFAREVTAPLALRIVSSALHGVQAATGASLQKVSGL